MKTGLSQGLGLLLVTIAYVGFSAEVSRPDLAGAVKSSNGDALRNATVFIYTAGPREGVGILCPSCYADCRKRATTDQQGKFAIEDLDPALLFRILVVAPGYRPEFVSKVDPASGALDVKLQEVSGGDTPDKQLRGRVLDSKDKPISGAVISIRGVTTDERTSFGGNTNVDPVAVTDNHGNFVIRSTRPFDAAGIDVEAASFAKRVFQRLATGGKVHELKLTEGTSIKGRLLKDGKPVGGVQMGVAGSDRSSEIFVGDYVVGTDKDGRFLFVNLPPQTGMYAYGIKKTLGSKGALPARSVTSGDDGSELDLGDLNLEPGYTVAGEVRLTDGASIPEKTRVLLSSEKAWDSLQSEVDVQGRFHFEGVPAESVNLSIRVKGYRLSARNRSLDLMNPFHLEGRVTTNITGLVVELEPGGRDPNAGPSAYVSLAEEPLQGAEKAKAGGDIKVTGTVSDKETGRPIAEFTVTPGRSARFGSHFDWITIRKETHANGAFEMFFNKQGQAPAVLVEAEGYFPEIAGPITGKGTNLVLALKKGSGPSGVLLTPEGEPARGVTVYLTDMRDSVYVSGQKAEANERQNRQKLTARTDDAGRFSFQPKADAFSLVVIDDAGFMDLPVASVGENARLTLERWARVEGELLIGKRPGTNESIRLGSAHLPYEHHPRTFPPVGLYLTTKTDDSGRFVFERVPPGAIQVYHEPKVRDSRVGTIAESQTTKVMLKAGETRKLTLGGKGRPVTGRFVVKDYDKQIHWRGDVQRLETVVADPEDMPDLRGLSLQYSAAVRKASTDEEKEVARADYERQRRVAIENTKAFYASEAGRNYHFAKRRFALNFSPDGSFRVEDVPAGKYSLNIDLHEGEGTSRMSSPRIAQLQREIEVPGADRSDEPFDLGTIELQARPVLTKGKPAPEFEVKTLDDRTIKLSDFRGKYVLLDFWAVWCGPCVAETPNLKEAYDAFKDDSRFAMIGLSLDPDQKAPRDYAKKNSLGWIQAFLGEWSKTDLPSRYGVEGIPSIFLIGPDGTIVAHGLRGPNIKSAIHSALRTATAQK